MFACIVPPHRLCARVPVKIGYPAERRSLTAKPSGCEESARQPKRSIRIRSTGWPAATSRREACSAKALEPHT